MAIVTEAQQEEARRLLEAIPPTAGGPVVDLLATVIAERDKARAVLGQALLDLAERTKERAEARADAVSARHERNAAEAALQTALADLRERIANVVAQRCKWHVEQLATVVRAVPLRRET